MVNIYYYPMSVLMMYLQRITGKKTENGDSKISDQGTIKTVWKNRKKTNFYYHQIPGFQPSFEQL